MENQLYQFFQETWIFLIIIIIIMITFYGCYTINNNKEVEGFDARIPNISKEKCGDLCTSIIGCQGFAYDSNSPGICYLSKSAILGKSVNSVFSDEYSTSDYRCNKTQPILDETDIISPNLMRRNSLYMCSDSEQGRYTLQLIAPTKRQSVGDFDDIEKIDVPNYEINDKFEWPTDKVDTRLNNNINQTGYAVYEKSRDEFLGQYLYPQKCTADISELSCIRICESDDRCVGVEWNPSYLKYKADVNGLSNSPNSNGESGGAYEAYKDICCPKTQISQIIPRRKEFINGNFYIKKRVDVFDKDRFYIMPK
jgi:hypothetical protein